MALLAVANGGSGVGLGPANVCGACLRVVNQDRNEAMAAALETLGNICRQLRLEDLESVALHPPARERAAATAPPSQLALAPTTPSVSC